MGVFGYIRVSTQEQNLDRQIQVMEEIPGIQLYIDKVSGVTFDRPEYKKMVKRLRKGDVLYIKAIDRLGRNYNEVLEHWRVLTKEKGIDIVVLDIALLDTRRGKDLLGTFIADLTLNLLSYVSQSERDTLRKRQAEGIAAAKKRGVKFGREMIEMPDNFGELVEKWDKSQISTEEVLETCGISRTTFYRRRYEYNLIKNLKQQEGDR